MTFIYLLFGGLFAVTIIDMILDCAGIDGDE